MRTEDMHYDPLKYRACVDMYSCTVILKLDTHDDPYVGTCQEPETDITLAH